MLLVWDMLGIGWLWTVGFYVPDVFLVHKNQQSTVGLRPTYLTQPTWVWHINWVNDPSQAPPKREHVTPLQAVPYPVPSPSRQTDSRIPKWLKPSFSTDLQPPTPHSLQNRKSKPASILKTGHITLCYAPDQQLENHKYVHLQFKCMHLSITSTFIQLHPWNGIPDHTDRNHQDLHYKNQYQEYPHMATTTLDTPYNKPR